VPILQLQRLQPQEAYESSDSLPTEDPPRKKEKLGKIECQFWVSVCRFELGPVSDVAPHRLACGVVTLSGSRASLLSPSSHEGQSTKSNTTSLPRPSAGSHQPPAVRVLAGAQGDQCQASIRGTLFQCFSISDVREIHPANMGTPAHCIHNCISNNEMQRHPVAPHRCAAGYEGLGPASNGQKNSAENSVASNLHNALKTTLKNVRPSAPEISADVKKTAYAPGAPYDPNPFPLTPMESNPES
jgi:hypothetical protein